MTFNKGTIMNERDEIERIITLSSSVVRKNTKILSAEDIGQPSMFHIAKTRMRNLVPNISRRGAPSEDNTLPRIHVSTSLQGCLIGYGAVIHDAADLDVKNTVDDITYLGGYYVYTIPYNYAIKPNKTLVYDAELSKEHWLVTYNKDTIAYKPSCVDKLIVNNCVFSSETNKKSSVVVSMAIEVTSLEGLRLLENRILTKGCYRFNYIKESYYEQDGYRHVYSVSEPTSISKAEFMEMKNIRAAMLSMNKPNKCFNGW